MKIENPFESGHIKNYILLYASVVVIMILFFIATTLFHDVSSVDEKVFNYDKNSSVSINKELEVETPPKKRFKLLERGY
ncbi:MAG TPA: hypothetical protein VLZ29_02490 [Sulfurimonas sp.]|jgi:hypothetical protein|uniref:hypothetical protein n=1 Tax=Sulfurimonas sp. TaxID=2022749 RepID=UPI002BD0721D|nr:hypothetical protein [Sulfurimonas sp.]HUH41962.1 hypothetical protein [Sulfurimonas sp.]